MLPVPTLAHAREAAARLVRAMRPDRVLLFGSVARGEATVDSDLDLLVIGPYTARPLDRMIEARLVLADLPVSKDVFVVTPEEAAQAQTRHESVIKSALAEGIELYPNPAGDDA